MASLSRLPDAEMSRTQNSPYPVYEVTDIKASAGSCLKTVGAMFAQHGHQSSAKMVVLVATDLAWSHPRHVQEAAALRGDSFWTAP